MAPTASIPNDSTLNKLKLKRGSMANSVGMGRVVTADELKPIFDRLHEQAQRITALELQNQLLTMRFDTLVAMVDRQRREQVALRERVDRREWVD